MEIMWALNQSIDDLVKAMATVEPESETYKRLASQKRGLEMAIDAFTRIGKGRNDVIRALTGMDIPYGNGW
jgi:regulator of extracellular matrix RemA (YlzA/DUF370 family)